MGEDPSKVAGAAQRRGLDASAGPNTEQILPGFQGAPCAHLHQIPWLHQSGGCVITGTDGIAAIFYPETKCWQQEFPE